jgi:hypothetical protein
MDVNFRYTDYLRGAEKPHMEQAMSISCPYCPNKRSFTSEKSLQQHIDSTHKDKIQERNRERDREKEKEREREKQRKSSGSPEGHVSHSPENQTTKP